MTTRKTATGISPGTAKPDIRARCGFHCSSCPSYKENARTDADKKRVSEGWEKIYGFTIPPEAIYCDGCLEPDENNPRRIGKTCPIRTCVLDRKIAHCGECGTFPCELIEKHLQSVETVVPKAKEILSSAEYRNFVEPYLCREFLSGPMRK
nr:DUF3795 domain-containing protein [uncultured Methanoregula sp.]